MHTWPLATAPATLSRNDNADTVLNEWILAWVAHQVPRHPTRLFDANIFYPERRTLAFSENLFVPAVMVAPIQWLGGSPVLAYNIGLILGFALTGWSMAFVVTRWTGDWAAGILAGCLMSFNAHTLTRLPHMQAIHVEFLPLALLALDELLSNPGVGRSVRLALMFVLQALSSIYTLVFSCAAMTLGALVRPADWRGEKLRRVLPMLAAAAAVAVALLLPFLLPYYNAHREQGLTRTLDEVALYSVSARDYLSTGGRLHFALWSHRFYRGTDALFPGVTASVMTLTAIATGVATGDRRARMCLAFGVAGAALSFGPAFPPCTWLYHMFPPLAAIRGAARFGYLALVSMAALSGFGLAWFRQRELHTRSRIISSSFVALALVVLANTEAMRAPIRYVRAAGIPAVYDVLADESNAVVVEFPFYPVGLVDKNARYLLASTRHWKPLVNGYSGFTPASYVRHAEQLEGFPDTRSLEALRAMGVTHVVVHVDDMPELTPALTDLPDFVPLASGRGIRLYKLR